MQKAATGPYPEPDDFNLCSFLHCSVRDKQTQVNEHRRLIKSSTYHMNFNMLFESRHGLGKVPTVNH
jgi:hypothetical protein